MKCLILSAMIGIATLTGEKQGTASIYSDKYHGRKTASGEIFSQKKLTAASNVFKLGTHVRVKNEKTGKEVEVLVNDRMAKGMEKRGRIIDLSRTAALEIGLTERQGLAKVTIEEIEL